MATNEETNEVRRTKHRDTPLDPIDRRILGVLVEDATTSYARIGEAVHLSAPATHERVKRLRARGVIRRTSVALDPVAIDKPLLAFVHLSSDGWGAKPELMTLAELPEVEEVHSVTGSSCMILKVRTAGPIALEEFLRRLYETSGVRTTQSYVVLSTYLERGVQAEVTLS